MTQWLRRGQTDPGGPGPQRDVPAPKGNTRCPTCDSPATKVVLRWMVEPRVARVVAVCASGQHLWQLIYQVEI